ncbi:hypothetical protein HAPAU_40410 [Halalkalicoccus paucihalophilus]|uniref:Uncharacterized protein n=1 Tax=Halalkalicoccus paucihalophilus TaxID=1008153 RepID=A0A151A8Y6_9EURY|nr:hypothetical protein [Halalkalicoccus paucihalophilus]KYH23962.1 hypothetical protein HAPAU_40410 [Halalkalicoccus paucihalophilus]
MDANGIKTISETGNGGTTGEREGDRTTKGTTDGGTRHHRHDGEITELTTASGGEMSATEHKCVAAGGAKLSETKASKGNARSLLEVGYSITYLLAPCRYTHVIDSISSKPSLNVIW